MSTPLLLAKGQGTITTENQKQMNDQKPKPSTNSVKELLLADHAHFSSMFANSEQAGETRVNWFIGIVTATSGGLLALFVKQHEQGTTPLGQPVFLAITLIALSALLVFGLLTLRRMMLRNSSTDRQKHALDQIRQLFQDYFDPDQLLLSYHPLGPPRRPKTSHKQKTAADLTQSQSRTKSTDAQSTSGWSNLREFWDDLNNTSRPTRLRTIGGLAHTVAAINSLIVAALFVLTFFGSLNPEEPATRPPVLELLALGFNVAVIAFALQWFWIGFSEYKERNQLRAAACTHAGGVVYRRSNGAVEYLVVRPSDPLKDEWVLPKGKIETNESHQEAALREVWEEANVRAKVVRVIGESFFKVEGKPLRIKFYLMEVLEGGLDAGENRESLWREFGDALEMLTHQENRRILRLASKLAES